MAAQRLLEAGKRIVAALAALVLAAALVPAAGLAGLAPRAEAAGGSGSSYGFSDVTGDEWYATDDVLGYAVDNGLLTGFADGTFGGGKRVTRGQMVTILWRMAGCPDAEAEAFEDVDYSRYYGDAISWARAEGVVQGYTDADGVIRSFRPDKAVTRQELAVMLCNYAREVEHVVVDSDGELLAAMPDASAVSAWAEEALAWCLDAGLMSGTVEGGVNYVRPKRTALRSHVAKMASALDRDVLPPDVGEGACEASYADGVVVLGEGVEWYMASDGSVVVGDAGALSGVSAGSVVVLPANDDYPGGYAYAVESVDGATASGGQAALEDVYDSLYLEGTADAADFEFEAAEGSGAVATFVDEDDADDDGLSTLAVAEGSASAGKIKIDLGTEDGGELYKDDDGSKVAIEGTISLTVEPKAEYLVDYSDSTFHQAYVAVSADVSLEGELKLSASGRYKVGELSAAGLVGVGVYLVVSMDGSVSVECEAQAMAGFNYVDGSGTSFFGDASCDGLTAELEASAKVGVGFSADLAVLMYDLAKAGFDLGVNASASSAVRDTGLVCEGGKAYLFLDAKVGEDCPIMETLGITWTKSFFTASTSPCSTSWHFEDGVQVESCTWGDDDLGQDDWVDEGASDSDDEYIFYDTGDDEDDDDDSGYYGEDALVDDEDGDDEGGDDGDDGDSEGELTDGWTACGTCEWIVDDDGVLRIRPLGNGDYGELTSSFGWKGNTDATSVVISGTIALGNNANYLFSNLSNITAIEGIDNLDTSNTSYMNYLFNNCYALESLDLSGLDTSHVVTMKYFFYNCYGLTSLDLTGFDTSSVQYMNYMFCGCEALESLDVSGFDTSSVVYMENMFCRCKSLTSLDLTSFDVSKVKTMRNMFYKCSSLLTLDLSSFVISDSTNTDGMFYYINSDCTIIW